MSRCLSSSVSVKLVVRSIFCVSISVHLLQNSGLLLCIFPYPYQTIVPHLQTILACNVVSSNDSSFSIFSPILIPPHSLFRILFLTFSLLFWLGLFPFLFTIAFSARRFRVSRISSSGFLVILNPTTIASERICFQMYPFPQVPIPCDNVMLPSSINNEFHKEDIWVLAEELVCFVIGTKGVFF